MNGYDLANEVFDNIGLNKDHEISLDDAIRVISFWGFNEEGNKFSRIGFVCYCARERIKKTFERALVWNDFEMFDEMIKHIQDRKEKTIDNQYHYGVVYNLDGNIVGFNISPDVFICLTEKDIEKALGSYASVLYWESINKLINNRTESEEKK